MPAPVTDICNFVEKLDYEYYLTHPNENFLPDEYTGGLNCLLPRTSLGAVSNILNFYLLRVYLNKHGYNFFFSKKKIITSGFKPYLVLDASSLMTAILAPLYEVVNCILAVLKFSPVNFRVGTRISFNAVVRTTEEDGLEVYNPVYLSKTVDGLGDVNFWHSLGSDSIWDFATGLSNADGNVY